MAQPELEICVDSLQSALQAEAGGASRIELCSALSEGGLTPSAGFMEMVKQRVHVPVHVLIRPRRGDFLYSADELAVMKQDIGLAKQLGIEGVVLGMLQANGQVDMDSTAELIAEARPMSVTFHRAFDLTPDPYQALEAVMALRVDRLLTSGQQQNALLGADLIAALIRQAGERLIVMPGGGIQEGNIRELMLRTGARAYHASARSLGSSSMQYQNTRLSMGGAAQLSEYECLITDAALVRRLREAITQQKVG